MDGASKVNFFSLAMLQNNWFMLLVLHHWKAFIVLKKPDLELFFAGP